MRKKDQAMWETHRLGNTKLFRLFIYCNIQLFFNMPVRARASKNGWGLAQTDPWTVYSLMLINLTSSSVVLARLGLKAVGKAQLFVASAFQNWSLSPAHRLGPAQAQAWLRPRPVWNLSGDFHACTKKNQVTSFGWQRHDNIYICIFNSFSYIYMNLKSLLPCFTI